MQFSLGAESYSPTRAKRWLGQFPPTGLFLPWSCPVIYLDFSFSNAIKSKVKVAFASCFQSTHIWETPVSHSLPAGPFFAVIKPQKSKKTTPKKPPHHEIWWVFFPPFGFFKLLNFLLFPMLTFLSYTLFSSGAHIHKSVASQGFVKTCCFSWNVLAFCNRADSVSPVLLCWSPSAI